MKKEKRYRKNELDATRGKARREGSLCAVLGHEKAARMRRSCAGTRVSSELATTTPYKQPQTKRKGGLNRQGGGKEGDVGKLTASANVRLGGIGGRRFRRGGRQPKTIEGSPSKAAACPHPRGG